MAEYTIEKISELPPRVWQGPHGDVYYIKTKLRGWKKPVSIGKKSPDALSVGQTIYGVIQETDLPEDKWHPEQKPQEFHDRATKSNYQPRDDEAIKAQFAIKAAVEWHRGNEAMSIMDVESTAKQFYAMIDRVKGSDGLKAEGVKVQTASHDDFKDKIVEVDENTVINLDDIPF